ncbi:MAG: DNA polymerase I [Eubacterium sp.]|nr:DNA polymerase I [Eubacterium sp.]
MKRLLLIDGNSIMNRGFFALPSNLTNSKGLHTNALLGFLNIFYKIYGEENPDGIAVAFDVHEPTFRHKEYAEYKAGRRSMPDELREQFPVIKEILASMGIKCIEQGGIEADDIIGTLAVNGESDGYAVTVLSGDRDLLQLASEKVMVRIPKTKAGKTVMEDYDADGVMKLYGVTPTEFIDMKGLMGDSSDNIPGVKGIGEKTAARLISTYHSIEGIYEHINEIMPAGVKTKLEAGKDDAVFSRWLATIKTDCELGIKPDDIAVSKDVLFGAAARDMLTELGLRSILSRFDFADSEKKEFIPEIVDISDINDILSEAGSLSADSVIGIYPAEADGELLFTTFAIGDKCYLAPASDISSKDVSGLIEKFIKAGIFVSFLNLKENIGLFELSESDKLFDSTLAAYLIKYRKEFSYDTLAEEYLDIIMPDEKTLKGKKELTAFSSADPDIRKLFAYKAYTAAKLCPILRDRLKTDGLYDLYYKIELPCVFVLYDMEHYGIRTDRNVLLSYGQALSDRINELTKEIYELVGEEFNINSTKQLGVILFEKLHLSSGKKTKTGYSTNADVLAKLKEEHPIINLILEYRSLTKLLSTYVEGLTECISDDGRIHSKFNQTIAATGRLSSTEPNLQNIPMRSELGREIRKAFIPEDGYTFIDADYSQIELRVMAHLSRDQALIDAFNQGDDIHAITAANVFKVPLEEVDSNMRRSAKAVNFGIIYGISSFGLGEDLGLSRKEAQGYIDEYFETYKGVKIFLDAAVSKAKRVGYVRTMFGRKREIPEISASNFMQRQFGERVAMNSPIQGTAADIIKIAMINVRRALNEKGLKSRLILQIHDELLIEAKTEEADTVKELLKDAMMNAAKLSVPLIIDMHQADDLYDAK